MQIEHLCVLIHICAKGDVSAVKLVTPPANFVCGGYTVYTLSVRASVRASVRNALFP